MREIKFRGKRVDNGDWVYGNLIYERSCLGNIINCFIAEYVLEIYSAHNETTCFSNEVDPETVGEFTGLCDKNGKEIYEGDICNIDGEDEKSPIFWLEGSFSYWGGSSKSNLVFRFMPLNKGYEVIGNIHDNKELLEVQE